MMTYFKKVNPRMGLYLSDGNKLMFQAVDDQTGIYPPEGQGISEALSKEIEKAIAAQQGGVTKIDQTEYDALVQKKKLSPPSRRTWRQEFQVGSLPDTSGRQSLGLPVPQSQQNQAAAAAAASPVATAEPPKATKR